MSETMISDVFRWRGVTFGRWQPSDFMSSKNAVSYLPVNSRRVVLVSRTRRMILSSTSVMFATCLTS